MRYRHQDSPATKTNQRYPFTAFIQPGKMRNLKAREQQVEEKAFMEARDHAISYALGMVIKATIELGVFDLLAALGPHADLTTGEISAKLFLSNTAMLDNMLRHLASHSIITSSLTTDEYGRSEKRYGLTPTSRLMANTKDGESMAPFVLLTNHKYITDSWHYLKEAVQEGVTPFRKAHGVTTYECMAKNPAFGDLFNKAMENQSNLITENIINKYRDGLMQINELVDVGGGIGATLGNIVSNFPHIKGINFDLPHVVSQAPSIPGLKHIGGDMFDEIPSGEAILFKSVFHNWDDEHCLTILKNCWKALPHSGKVIIVEYILPEATDANFCTHIYDLSMMMMILCDGGKERTENEFRLLAKEACFSEFKSCCEFLNFHVMELVK